MIKKAWSKTSEDLCKLRMSSHNLEIERGRYINVPRENRICTNCTSGFIENEYHFALICSMHADLRSNFMKRYYYTWPTTQKLSNLLSTNSKSTLRNFSKFIYFANIQRK